MKRPPGFGIDTLLKDKEKIKKLRCQKVAVLTNQKTLTQTGMPSAYALYESLGKALQVILTPEHGWSGTVAEGVKVENGWDEETGLPVISLYGGKKSFEEIQETYGLDALIIDLQDMGIRCYTYGATCAQLLDAAQGYRLKIEICDRPNPLGPVQKGPALDPVYRSFLAYLDIPFQHGQTMGHLLQTYNQTLGLGKLDLEIIPSPPFHVPYAYLWDPPSPNLPSWDAALLYPALVLLEGVNVSEGRGTPFPFTSFGAPGLDFKACVDFLNALPKTGIRAEPFLFKPQTGKLKDQDCQGVRLHIKDPHQVDGVSLGFEILRFLKKNYPLFQWTPCLSDPENKKYFIDALLGTSSLRQELEKI